jgi:hypothetical protein
MILPVVALFARFSTDGLFRVLDQNTRSYAVHLEITGQDAGSTSDYEIVLAPVRRTKQDGPGEARYLSQLKNLTLTAGEFKQKRSNFGGGPLVFRADGVPTPIITEGFDLTPLLSFYVPGSGGHILTEIPVSQSEVAPGWRLVGTAKIGMDSLAGQAVDMAGNLTRVDGMEFKFAYHATLDSKSGWLVESKGNIEGDKFSIAYAIKLEH